MLSGSARCGGNQKIQFRIWLTGIEPVWSSLIGRCREDDDFGRWTLHGLKRIIQLLFGFFEFIPFMRTTCFDQTMLSFAPNVLISRPISWLMNPSFGLGIFILTEFRKKVVTMLWAFFSFRKIQSFQIKMKLLFKSILVYLLVVKIGSNAFRNLSLTCLSRSNSYCSSLLWGGPDKWQSESHILTDDTPSIITKIIELFYGFKE